MLLLHRCAALNDDSAVLLLSLSQHQACQEVLSSVTLVFLPSLLKATPRIKSVLVKTVSFLLMLKDFLDLIQQPNKIAIVPVYDLGFRGRCPTGIENLGDLEGCQVTSSGISSTFYIGRGATFHLASFKPDTQSTLQDLQSVEWKNFFPDWLI